MENIKNTSKKIVKGLFYPDNKMSLIPNWLSFSRAIGGVAIPIMSHKKVSNKIILTTTSFLALTDFLDGKAARYIAGNETNEGALLDVVSDKIFSLSLISGIIPKQKIFIINGALEGTISIINATLLDKGGKPQSNTIGKIKIWPLSIALTLGYLSSVTDGKNKEAYKNISNILALMTIPLEIINIVQYENESKKQLSLQKDNHQEIIMPGKTNEKQKRYQK